jgi:hypothetical protein
MVPRDGLIAIEDRNSISVLGIAGDLERNKAGFRRPSGVQRLRQQGCQGCECREGKEVTAVQLSKGNHILKFLVFFRTLCSKSVVFAEKSIGLRSRQG